MSEEKFDSEGFEKLKGALKIQEPTSSNKYFNFGTSPGRTCFS